ncbi:MAG: glutathione binding-like protein, partial [Woeseiaceae bacterium]
HEGAYLTEVVAICHYLEEVRPAPALFGETPEERAVTMMWNAKAELQGLWAMADAFRNSVKGLQGHALPGPDSYEQIPELAVRGQARVEAFFKKMDGQLASNEFLAGSRFTIADITALVLFDFAARMKISPAEGQDNLLRWYASVSARPSAAL